MTRIHTAVKPSLPSISRALSPLPPPELRLRGVQHHLPTRPLARTAQREQEHAYPARVLAPLLPRSPRCPRAPIAAFGRACHAREPGETQSEYETCA